MWDVACDGLPQYDTDAASVLKKTIWKGKKLKVTMR